MQPGLLAATRAGRRVSLLPREVKPNIVSTTASLRRTLVELRSGVRQALRRAKQHPARSVRIVADHNLVAVANVGAGSTVVAAAQQGTPRNGWH